MFHDSFLSIKHGNSIFMSMANFIIQSMFILVLMAWQIYHFYYGQNFELLLRFTWQLLDGNHFYFSKTWQFFRFFANFCFSCMASRDFQLDHHGKQYMCIMAILHKQSMFFWIMAILVHLPWQIYQTYNGKFSRLSVENILWGSLAIYYLYRGSFIRQTMADLLISPWQIYCRQYGNFIFTHHGNFASYMNVHILVHLSDGRIIIFCVLTHGIFRRNVYTHMQVHTIFSTPQSGVNYFIILQCHMEHL